MHTLPRPAVAVVLLALAAVIALALVSTPAPKEGAETPIADDEPIPTTAGDVTVTGDTGDDNGSISLVESVSPGGTGKNPDAGHTLQAV